MTLKIRSEIRIVSKIRTLINIIVSEWKIRFSSSLLSSLSSGPALHLHHNRAAAGEHRSVKGDLVVLKTVLVHFNFYSRGKKKKEKNLPI